MRREELMGNLEKLLSQIDISPTMYENATKKYRALAEYLIANGVPADFKPQGSFRTGTVVRPLRNGEEANYDLDIMCQLHHDKKSIDPQKAKGIVGDTIENSELYSAKLLPEDSCCWTLEYAKVDDSTGFLLDIVPCISSDHSYVDELICKGISSLFAQEATDITSKLSSGKYVWVGSNSLGYALWFDSINEPYIQLIRQQYRSKLFAENRNIYSTIENVPKNLERSALQRVIQILKRHRDVFYYQANKWNYRPTSAIITTICSQIASHTQPTGDVFELLQIVAEEISAHHVLETAISSASFEGMRKDTYIKKYNGEWKILSPVNPDDNFASDWTNAHAQMFFKWINAVIEDFFVGLNESNGKYYVTLKNAFGKQLVERVLPETKTVSATVISNGTKPWGMNE